MSTPILNKQAHEVRNPLSVAITGLAFVKDILKEVAPLIPAKVLNKINSDLGMVSTSIQFIEELLTSILDLHKFLEGKIVLQSARVSILHDVLEPVAAMLSTHSRANVELSVVTDDPLWVNSDALKLKQVVMNLAKNAVKFVPFGFIHLGAKREGDGRVVVWVADSGLVP